MSSQVIRLTGRGGACLPLLCSVLAAAAAAAESQRPRDHVMLPPALGGTPLSLQIEAEAHYLAARGDLVESVAVARKIHAEAVALEIQNSIDAVDAFFKRRALNREWRAKENPNRLAREENLQKVRRQRLESQFQDVLKGDLTAQLNWLLAEVSGPALAYQYLGGTAGLNDSELNAKLDPQTVNLLSMSDGGRSGSKLVFSAKEAKLLETRWPAALRGGQFEELRTRFEAGRDALLAEARAKRKADPAHAEPLVKCIDELMVGLAREYPAQRQKEISEFLAYQTAKRYLRSLAAQVHRVVETEDPAILDGSLRFQGERLLDLIAYMDRSGLTFAPAPPGGERAYRAVLADMRNLWLALAKRDVPAGERNEMKNGK